MIKKEFQPTVQEKMFYAYQHEVETTIGACQAFLQLNRNESAFAVWGEFHQRLEKIEVDFKNTFADTFVIVAKFDELKRISKVDFSQESLDKVDQLHTEILELMKGCIRSSRELK